MARKTVLVSDLTGKAIDDGLVILPLLLGLGVAVIESFLLPGGYGDEFDAKNGRDAAWT